LEDTQVGQSVLLRSLQQKAPDKTSLQHNKVAPTNSMGRVGTPGNSELQSAKDPSTEKAESEQPAFDSASSPPAVTLRRMRISGQLSLNEAHLDSALDAEGMQVGSYADITNASFAKPVNMRFVHIGSNLDLRGARLAELDLRGAVVTGDLQLADAKSYAIWQTGDKRPGRLILRNAHVGTLMETSKAWPEAGNLSLYGFGFDRFGVFDGDTDPYARRPLSWWKEWTERDTTYSPLPYTHLANVLGNLGNRDLANDIRYLGHERAREEACKQWAHDRHTCIVQGALGLVAGYGVGLYSFRVLYWVFGFAIAGALLLWFTVPAVRAAHRGPFWCFGASLSQLIPVVQMNKEFSDFFDDPQRQRLRGWQVAAFSAMSIIGWILGGILVLAVSGLTQNP
jgi:hypothetical protein